MTYNYAMNHVEQFYDQQSEYEWHRLERHRTEYAVTLRTLLAHLSPAPLEIIDIGGGPGRYAIALSQRGDRVTLVDLAQANLDLAAQKASAAGVRLNASLHRDARQLYDLPGDHYDAALLLGPLYHLLDLQERRQAIGEALRVLKPGGLLFAAFISRFAFFRDAAKKYPEEIYANPRYAGQLLATGMHDGESGFTRAYFAHPAEIVPLMETTGLQTIELVGCEGIVAALEEKVNELSGADWETWVDFNYRIGHDPAALGAADHLLYIGRKVA